MGMGMSMGGYKKKYHNTSHYITAIQKKMEKTKRKIQSVGFFKEGHVLPTHSPTTSDASNIHSYTYIHIYIRTHASKSKSKQSLRKENKTYEKKGTSSIYDDDDG